MEANLINLGWIIGLLVVGFIGLQTMGRAYRGVAAFLNLDEASWWRTTLPWPRGVQEDDEVHFNIVPERPAAALDEPPGPWVEDILSDQAAVGLQRPEGHVRIR